MTPMNSTYDPRSSTQDNNFNTTQQMISTGVVNGLCTRDGDNRLGANLSYLYYFMFIFSVVTNVLVLVIIHRFEKLTNVINILLVNLVASSLIFMSSLPFVGVYMQRSEWIFGQIMCKIVFSAYYMGFYSSVFFLTLLTIDRYIAVVFSLLAVRLRNQRYAVISCAVVWLVSGLACVRPMFFHSTFIHLGKQYCEEMTGNLTNIDVKMLKRAGFYIQLFVFLILPLAVIIFCYVRIVITIISSNILSKFRTVRLVFIIVLIFFICWIPFNIVELLHDETNDCKARQKHGYALQITRNMAYFYFCISPIFYTLVGRKFQEYFRQLLVKSFPGLKRYISLAECSPTTMPTKILTNKSQFASSHWHCLRTL
ncbi:C-C chemokine receptor type 1-like [Anableps anableps]